MGGAGREFHDFNTYFRNRPQYEVLAFVVPKGTATEGKRYPPDLCGAEYPAGIPIETDGRLGELIRAQGVEEVVFSVADVPYTELMHRASIVSAAGAGFRFLGPRQTQLRSERPVVAVSGVRTGVGKSSVARYVAGVLKELGRQVAIVHHPVPTATLDRQAAERFDNGDALRASASLDEREEFEPHVDRGFAVFSGVDVEQALFAAEEDADTLLWESGTSDTPFLVPDLHITVCDPLRAGQETQYFPGEANVRLAHLLVINKVSTARPDDTRALRARLAELNPTAAIVDADSAVMVNAEALRGKRAIILEDGPTLIHGGIGYGAGLIAAIACKAEIVDPRPHAVGTLKAQYEAHPEWQRVIPVTNLSRPALQEIADTVQASAPDVVVVSTPADLREELRGLGVATPLLRVTYEVEERSGAPLRAAIAAWVDGLDRRDQKSAAS